MNNMNLPHFIKRGGNITIANIDMDSSPFGDVEAAFHWQKKDYPFAHTHTHWEMFVVIQGEILHTINDKKFLLTKGDACLIRPNDNHRLDYVKKSNSNHQFLNFMMSNNFTEKLLDLHNSYEDLLHAPEPFHFTLDDLELASIYDKCLYIQNLPKDLYNDLLNEAHKYGIPTTIVEKSLHISGTRIEQELRKRKNQRVYGV